MYCSSCGGAILPGLTYCNHCGARQSLAKREEIVKQADINPDSLVWAIVGVFIAGMGTIIGLMAVMKNVLHFNMGLIMFFSILSFSLMTIIETVFIWRFIGRRVANEQVEPPQLTEKAKLELGSVEAKALAEPLHSVTSQTTRSFEPIYTKPTSE